MPRKLFLFACVSLFLLFTYFFLIHNSQVIAQVTPTGIPTCDLCGWCNPATSPKPPDWDTCRTCLYDASGLEKKGSSYTVFGCLSTKPEEFVKSILSIVFGVAGGIAFLAVLGGSAIVLTSGGNPEKLQTGKDTITSSLLGILIIVFSVFLLRVVGFDILKIPGFG